MGSDEHWRMGLISGVTICEVKLYTPFDLTSHKQRPRYDIVSGRLREV